MRIQNWLVAAGIAAAMSLGAVQSLAQPGPGGGGGGGGGFGPGGGGGFGGGRRGNFDPAQMRQMMMDGIRGMLEVENEDEWKVLEPLVQKVVDAQAAARAGLGRGMGMMFRRAGAATMVPAGANRRCGVRS